jgi:hypothetical protein
MERPLYQGRVLSRDNWHGDNGSPGAPEHHRAKAVHQVLTLV